MTPEQLVEIKERAAKAMEDVNSPIHEGKHMELRRFNMNALAYVSNLIEALEAAEKELEKERAFLRSCKHPGSFHLTLTQETLDARLRIERREEREEIVAMLEGMKLVTSEEFTDSTNKWHRFNHTGTDAYNQALTDCIEAIRGRG